MSRYGPSQRHVPIGGVRVRAIAADHGCTADGCMPDAAFVHPSPTVGAGRGPRVPADAGDVTFEAMKAPGGPMR